MPKTNGCRTSAAQRRAAYHEAGHAVARYRLPRAGGGRSIWIDGVGARGGPNHRAACSRPSLNLRLPEALDRIQVCLAGAIAERRVTGRIDRSAQQIDRARAVETALRVSFEPETGALLRWMALRSERLVEFYWSDVDAVARALIERRSLTAREIEAVIRGAETGRHRPGTARSSSRARDRSGVAPRRRRSSARSLPASGRQGSTASA